MSTTPVLTPPPCVAPSENVLSPRCSACPYPPREPHRTLKNTVQYSSFWRGEVIRIRILVNFRVMTRVNRVLSRWMLLPRCPQARSTCRNRISNCRSLCLERRSSGSPLGSHSSRWSRGSHTFSRSPPVVSRFSQVSYTRQRNVV